MGVVEGGSGLSDILFKGYSLITSSQAIENTLVSMLILLVFWLLRKAFTRYLFAWIMKIALRTGSRFDDKVLTAFYKPLQTLFIVTGIYLALLYLPLDQAQNDFVNQVYRTGIVIIVTWGIYAVIGIDSLLSQEIRGKYNIDNILFVFLSRAARFVIIALALVIVAQEWDYEVNGFIAGLGLGGLAFALAAQDMLSNIFGGIIIVMEKPFSIGDWIATPSVEGIVEDISFRSTKIKAFTRSVVTIPNSTLANEPITNYSRMDKWRITFHLKVVYSTPIDKMEKCSNRIRAMLAAHPEIEQETIIVNWEHFADSSLDMFLYFFMKTKVFREHHRIKEDIILKILAILKEEEVSIAIPSRSIYLENEANYPDTAANLNKD